jgi:low affinity Fe/Cu permease
MRLERALPGRSLSVGPQRRMNRFDRLAEGASRFVSKGAFFTICVVTVAIWVPTLVLFKSVDTWQLVLNTVTSVSAFLLIALLQNTERRYDEALHRKIDALAEAVADLLEREAAQRDGPELEQVHRDVDALRDSIELERRVGS